MPSQLPYIICSGLLVLLNIAPLYWQFGQGNSGPIAMGVWVVIANLNEFVNAVVWFDNAADRAPVWCDISVKLSLGEQVGRLAAVFCIARFLADIVSPRATAMTRQDRRRRAIFDYSISFGVPILVMACHVIYQPNRYGIVRGLGCTFTQVMCWPALVLRIIWPPIFAVGGMLYSAYTVYRLVRHRRNFRRVVAGAHSALTTARFIRLAALSISYLCIGGPLAFYSAVSYIETSRRYTDYSWQYVHSAWKLEPVTINEKLYVADLSNWSNVIVGVIFFAAFGFGTEAMAAYARVSRSLRLPRAFQKFVPAKANPARSGRATAGDHYRANLAEKGMQRGIKVVVEEEHGIV
ncbi:Pheromone receptor mating-type A2 [Rhodotorula toruloides ATCC 204091]|uniref:Pheromone receptor mating-type A2 n=1 Tax=Rhodotorula toruloides TaxID=5286 RepID=A0A0K3CNC2_RHOTO|nr:Pheromone receptor mating-type A2 [Rhodotorula toruloides ATCC 204091]PRQ71086.1 pheromone receptor mating-type A2 [Rhodotorula toruloides]